MRNSQRTRFDPRQRLLVSPQIASRSIPDGVTVFASGTNRVADIRAAVAARVPIGVDVSRLSERGIAEIISSAVPVLLDSGAFSEVSTHSGRLEVTKEITDVEWRRRLAVYVRIARGLNEEGTVTAVAPDRVGSQELTLRRLLKFRAEVREVHGAGARILVPLQRGALSLTEFYSAAADLLGLRPVPGFPLKKAATTVQDIVDFVRNIRVPRIHLLGMGANNSKAKVVLRLVRHFRPDVSISMDANRIRASVGTRRAITVNETRYSEELASDWSGEVDLREWGGDVHDMTEMLFRPSSWLSGKRLQKFVNTLTWLSPEQQKRLLNDPDAFVNAEENENDWLHERLMTEYFACVQVKSRVAARTRAVFETLEVSTIAGQY